MKLSDLDLSTEGIEKILCRFNQPEVNSNEADNNNQTQNENGTLESKYSGDVSESKGSDELEEKRKKRRSRWGSAPTEGTSEGSSVLVSETAASNNAEEEEDDASKKKRKSRWSSVSTPANPSAVPLPTPTPLVPPVLTPEVIQQTLVLQMQLKQLNDQLLTVAADALQREMDPNRSPSPPPKYDTNGKRTNTREMRMRESLMSSRTKIIEDLIKLNPLFQVRRSPPMSINSSVLVNENRLGFAIILHIILFLLSNNNV